MLTNKGIAGPKIYVIGHGRSGKDTVCDRLVNQLGLLMTTSSYFCAKAFIFNTLRGKYGYKSITECFNDRHNHRVEWFTLISDYNSRDPTRLTRAIFKENHIYCGIRRRIEFEASVHAELPDLTIWVDAHRRVEDEGKATMELNAGDADYVINNNGNIHALEHYIKLAINELGLQPEWTL